MSNFSKISKSVKKSLCVLASASSIFSILPTAMAMKPAPKTNLSKKSISELELTELGKMVLLHKYVQECLEKSKTALQEKYDLFKKLFLKEKGYNYYKLLEFKKNFEKFLEESIKHFEKSNADEINFHISHKYPKGIFELYQQYLEQTGIGNCRIGMAAINCKATELKLKVCMIRFCTISKLPIHSVIIVKDGDGRIYLFDYLDALYTVLDDKNYTPIFLSNLLGEKSLKDYLRKILPSDGTKILVNLVDSYGVCDSVNNHTVSKDNLGNLPKDILDYVESIRY